MSPTPSTATRWSVSSPKLKEKETESRLLSPILAASQPLWPVLLPVRVVPISILSLVLKLTFLVVIKYFGFELGAQTNTNPSDDRWIINGAHEASKLQDYLDGFINKFVLCKKCKNPETDVVIKDGRILLDCKACGQRSDVDLRLKLSSFILKNQPKKGKKDKSTKKTRRDRMKENGDVDENGSKNGGSPGDSNSDHVDEENGDAEIDAGSDDELTRRIQTEAKEIEKNGDVKDDEWAVDVSAEAVKARAQELPDDLKRSLAFDDDEDGEGEGGHSAYDELGSWIISAAEKEGGVAKVEDVDIYVKAKELGIETKHKTLTVLAQTIFDENITKQIPKRASMLKKVCLLFLSKYKYIC
jgi:translation initiation factor 5